MPALGIVTGGVAVAVASVLPWATETAGPVTRSLNGLDREGVGLITGVLGVLLVGLGLLALGRRSRMPALLAFLAAVVAGLMGVAEALHQRDLDVLQEGVSVSLGFGLVVLVAGASVAGLGATAALLARRPPGA